MCFKFREYRIVEVGQYETEYRSARRAIFRPDPPAMRRDNLLGDRQANAEAAIFCGKERLEQAGQVAWIDSRT